MEILTSLYLLFFAPIFIILFDILLNSIWSLKKSNYNYDNLYY